MNESHMTYSDEAIMDDVAPAPESMRPPTNPDAAMHGLGRSPRPHKTRSLSDGENTPKLSPSPHIIEAARRTSKDDTSLHRVGQQLPAAPATVTTTPLRSNPAARGLSLQTTSTRDFAIGAGGGNGNLSRPATSSGTNLGGGGAGSAPRGGANAGGAINSCSIHTSGAAAAATLFSAGPAATTSTTTTTTSSSSSLTTAPAPSSATTPSASNAGFLKPTTTTPISPKLDHSQIYASPTSILPRRSRGLDFSRAATSLHHSTLADNQASPESSPTIGAGAKSGGPGSGRQAMNIPGRSHGGFGPEQSSSSLWSMMGASGAPISLSQGGNPSGPGTGHAGSNNNNTSYISSSLGSVNMLASESSSSSDEDDFMDDDMEEAFVSTPQVSRTMNSVGTPVGNRGGSSSWVGANGSPAPNSPAFQRPQRRMKQPKKKAKGGPLGLGLSAAAAAGVSKSPPNNYIGMGKDLPHARRESISWAANQLHISSGNDSDENLNPNSRPGSGPGAGGMDTDGSPVTPGRPNVIRRTVTRRQNLLPKTKGFARIKAELIEESAPIEADLRRESQVIRQVRESDMDLEPRISATTTALSSPLLGAADDGGDIPVVPDDMMMTDLSQAGGTFKQQAVRNSRGSKAFWDTFSECSSLGGGNGGGSASRTTPPPPTLISRGSTAAFGEDISMDSPIPASKDSTSNGGTSGPVSATAGFGAQRTGSQSDSQHSGTPQSQPLPPGPGGSMIPPTAAEITRRINSKRRREDDFDPVSFKRRAVSPGMSVHNSPIMQSPMQRDVAPWGSRPGSNGGDRSGAPSETGSLERGDLAPHRGSTGGNGGGSQSGGGGNGTRLVKGRVGFQGMVDTNDGLMRMSIE